MSHSLKENPSGQSYGKQSYGSGQANSKNNNSGIRLHSNDPPSFSYENKSEDGNLSIPHIADFYPEDNSTVPADNPRMSTLFLPKASGDKRKRIANQSNSFNNSSENNLNTLKKSNSCSTIYVDDSTVSQPNLKSAIRLVACAIHYHIKRRATDRSMEIFDEKMYPISVILKIFSSFPIILRRN